MKIYKIFILCVCVYQNAGFGI